MIDLYNLNYLAILVSGLISFGLGALWYSPVLFGKIWQKETSLSLKYKANSKEKISPTEMAQTYGASLVLMILMIFGLAISIQEYAFVNELNIWVGAAKGVFFGVFFAFTSVGIAYLYQRKSLKLFAIDTSYQILFLVISGIILSLWR